MQFSLQCGVSLSGGDMMVIFVYRFEDCLNACSSYNILGPKLQLSSNCTSVSFWAKFGGEGNCWLKGALGMDEMFNFDVDSAKVVQK